MDDTDRSAWVEAVLGFWFGELSPGQWFEPDAGLDAACRDRFSDLYARLADAVPDAVATDPHAALAAVIVLDQFPRNMFRATPQAFATDTAALALSERAIAAGLDRRLDVPERKFLYMPFQHSEERAVQARSVALFESLGDTQAADFARRHKVIVDRFGRFPHRNAILGRTSTAEEVEFLKQPGSAF